MYDNTVVSFSSFKGGVGKTTLAILTTLLMAMARLRVLVIDLDHQGNSTRWHYRVSPIPHDKTLASAIEFMDARSCIVPSHIHGCDILPVGFQILKHYSVPVDTLELLIDPIKDDYDVIVIDCPPSLNNLVVGAWSASDRIVTPARFDSFDQYGIHFLEEAIRSNTEVDLDQWTIVINFFKTPRSTDQMTLDLQYQDHFTDQFANLNSLRVTSREIIRKIVHEDRPFTRSRQTRELFDGVADLARWIAERPISFDEAGI